MAGTAAVNSAADIEDVHTAAPAAISTTDPAFCIRVQQQLAGTTMRAESNTVYDDYAAFRASKTTVNPLQIHQHVLPGETGSPIRVSCKIKTPDHLNAEYGPGTATDRGLGCRDINAETVMDVYASLAPAEQQRLAVQIGDIVFDEDESTFMGSSWVGDYPFAYTGDDGQLHLQAKNLRVDWNNFWLSWAPDRLRGAWYCHLAAPEYIRQLVLGEVTAPVR